MTEKVREIPKKPNILVMRLLKLPFQVQQFLTNGDLEFSHARELLNLLDPTMVVKIAEEAVKHHMNILLSWRAQN